MWAQSFRGNHSKKNPCSGEARFAPYTDHNLLASPLGCVSFYYFLPKVGLL